MFADDTALYVEFEDAFKAVGSANRDLTSTSKQAQQWLVKIFPKKTSKMVSLHKDKAIEPTLNLDAAVTSPHHFGIISLSNLSWHRHLQVNF